MSTRGADPTPGSTVTVQTHTTGDIKPTKTEYVVLELVTKGTAWTVLDDKVLASSGDAAIKQVDARRAEEKDPSLGYVAVPARSWQPVRPKTTTKTVTTLEPLV